MVRFSGAWPNADEDCAPTEVAVTTNPSCPVSSGTALTLQCSAVDPTKSGLSYQWLLNGQLLPRETAPTLVRRSVVKNAEVYTCQVSNRVGLRTANVTVIGENWVWRCIVWLARPSLQNTGHLGRAIETMQHMWNKTCLERLTIRNSKY